MKHITKAAACVCIHVYGDGRSVLCEAKIFAQVQMPTMEQKKEDMEMDRMLGLMVLICAQCCESCYPNDVRCYPMRASTHHQLPSPQQFLPHPALTFLSNN